MSRELRATAILDAKDNASGVFASVAKKLQGMEGKFRTMDRAANTMARSQAARFGEMLESSNRMVQGFRASHAAMIAARTAFRSAEENVTRLGRAMKDTAAPTAKMATEYERAQRAVKGAAAAYREKIDAVKAAKSQMAGYGVTLKNVGTVEATLRRNRRFGSPAPSSPPASSTPAGVPRHEGGGPAGVGEAIASGVGLQHVRDALVSGLNVDTERAQMRQAGWTKGEMKTAEHRANRLAAEWGVSPASAMNIIREGRPTFGGDLQQTLANVPDFFAVLTAMRQKNPKASEEENNRQLGNIIKAGEIMGYSGDPAKMRQYADFMTKMTQVHGSALRGEEILNFAKSGKTAASGANFDFLQSVLPTMLPELGGDRLGTALMTLRQALVGGKMKKRAAENLANLGIVDPAGFISTDDADVKGVKPDAVKGSKILEKNPLEWVKSVLLPAMNAKGISPQDQSSTLSTLFSDRNAEYIVNLMLEQMQRLEKDRATVDAALGLNGTKQALKDDAYLALARAKAGTQNAGAAVTDPAMETLKSAAAAAAETLNKIAEAARDRPGLTGGGLVGGGILGGLWATLASQGAGMWRLPMMAAGVGGGALTGGAMLPLLVSEMLNSDPRLRARAEMWNKIAPHDWEASRRRQDFMRRDPEAARGEAFSKLGKPSDLEEAFNALDLSSEGTRVGESFKTGLTTALEGAKTIAREAAAEIKNTLSFTATPKVTFGGLNQGGSRAGSE